MHEREEVFSMWGPDIPVVPPKQALYQFSIAVLAFVTFGFTVKYALVPDRPAVPRDYPFSGLVTELGGLEANKVRDAGLRSRSISIETYVVFATVEGGISRGGRVIRT